jgi:pyruvate-formate lyase-activating enzyme
MNELALSHDQLPTTHNLTKSQFTVVDTQLNELKRKYNVLGVFYLSNFFKPDGDKWLFEILKSVYRSEYQHLDKIVIVQDCADAVEFHEYPGQAISRLQQLLSQIDISNSFVMILSGDQDLVADLHNVRVMYSTDQYSMSHVYVKELEYTRRDDQSDTFCVLPWIHLYFGPDSKVFPCCQSDRTLPIGDTVTQPINDIIKSDRIKKLRSNMLHGRRSKECANCYKQEEFNSQSYRTNSNAQFFNQDTTYEEDPADLSIKWIEFSINKTCNLKCRMCSGYYSSAIANEEKKLYGIESMNTTAKQRAQVVDQLIPYLPNLTVIEFAGGEPLLTNEHYAMLDQLILCGNTDLEINYITNLTALGYKKYDIFSYWKQFSKIKILASLDAHGSVAEYVRSGTIWKNIEKNMHLLKTNRPDIEVAVSSTVGLMNVQSLIELQRNWHDQSILSITNFRLHPILTPEHLTVQVLPKKHKLAVEQAIQLHIDWCMQMNAVALANQWKDLLQYMWAGDNQHLLEEFKKIITLQDHARQQSFVTVFPEYRDLL